MNTKITKRKRHRDSFPLKNVVNTCNNAQISQNLVFSLKKHRIFKKIDEKQRAAHFGSSSLNIAPQKIEKVEHQS